MPQTAAYATHSADAVFEPYTLTRREPGPTEVLIDIAYAGICHSDIHTAREEWGKISFPLVPGHEIAGTVSQVGSEVTSFTPGDRVGVGCFVDSCRECPECRAGEEQYCTGGGMVGTYNATGRDGERTQGGYSQQITVDQDYVLRIPEGIDLAEAAPLLCAGITLYSPLRHWKVGPGSRVAIIGLGGLGHMGVKIAAAMGAEVTVLSQTLSKQEDGLAFGAKHYHATSDPSTFEQLAGSFDLIVNTVSAKLDLDAYLSLLALNGTLVEVGMPESAMELRPASVVFGRRSLAGSLIGGIRETQEMLDFCAEHGLGATVEVIRGDQITEAYDTVVGSGVRYRFVIDTSTFPAAS